MSSSWMATPIAYVSGLRPDFDPHELLTSLDLGANIDEIVSHVEAHGQGAVFIVFKDDRFVDLCILKYNGSTMLGSLLQVSRPTTALMEQLRRLNPTILKTKQEQTLQ